jgi:hypothetical protein
MGRLSSVLPEVVEVLAVYWMIVALLLLLLLSGY